MSKEQLQQYVRITSKSWLKDKLFSRYYNKVFPLVKYFIDDGSKNCSRLIEIQLPHLKGSYWITLGEVEFVIDCVAKKVILDD